MFIVSLKVKVFYNYDNSIYGQRFLQYVENMNFLKLLFILLLFELELSGIQSQIAGNIHCFCF